jgi:hypothetical protein
MERIKKIIVFVWLFMLNSLIISLSIILHSEGLLWPNWWLMLFFMLLVLWIDIVALTVIKTHK